MERVYINGGNKVTDNFKKCQVCGKIFKSLGNPRCPECLEAIEDYFYKIKDYLYDFPNAKIDEVSKELDVPKKIILILVKEERIMLVDASKSCMKCGKSIVSGKYCNDCLKAFNSKLETIAPKLGNKKQESDDYKSRSSYYSKSDK